MAQNKIKYSLTGLLIGLVFSTLVVIAQIFLERIPTHFSVEALKYIIKGIESFVAPFFVVLSFPVSFVVYCALLGTLLGYIATMRSRRKKMIIVITSLLMIQWLLLIIADINFAKAMEQLIKDIF